LGLKFTGLLGVLLAAKYNGFTPSVKILLDDIIAKAGFWVSKKVYVHTLQLAGE
jgi:predicted nucleic acid-binding protein